MPRMCCFTSQRTGTTLTSIGMIITQISSPTGRFTWPLLIRADGLGKTRRGQLTQAMPARMYTGRI